MIETQTFQQAMVGLMLNEVNELYSTILALNCIFLGCFSTITGKNSRFKLFELFGKKLSSVTSWSLAVERQNTIVF